LELKSASASLPVELALRSQSASLLQLASVLQLGSVLVLLSGPELASAWVTELVSVPVWQLPLGLELASPMKLRPCRCNCSHSRNR
jgi:hypothetical protein